MRLLSSGIPSLLLITLAFFVTVFSNAQESTTAEPVTTTPEESETVDLDATNDDQTSGFFPAEEVEAKKAEAAETTEPDDVAEATETAASKTAAEEKVVAPLQSGPFVDLLGPQLLSLEMLDATSAQLQPHYTNDALRGKKVVGLYFSADWCGPCRKFTPELTSFYEKMNNRRGKKDQFEIVWISRCRDVNSFGQYFTQMGKWLALPPEEAMGQRGQMLSNKYKVKGIPSLVLLDDVGNVITTDARNKIPQDKAGIGFPWRNPLATFYMMILPRSLRMMIKSQIFGIKDKLILLLKGKGRPKKALIA